MNRSVEDSQPVAYGPDPLDPDATQALMRLRRRDRDAPPDWWLRARKEPRSFHIGTSHGDAG